VLVSRTAAQIPGYGLADLLLGGIRILLQKGHQGQQNAWRAEATLSGMALAERFLDGMQIFRCAQPLDGRDLVAIGLHGEHQAGTDRLAVEQDSAGTTYPVLATDMRTSQAQVVAQEIAEQQSWLDRAFIQGAIYIYGNSRQIAHLDLRT
jgi:hypothetical protein